MAGLYIHIPYCKSKCTYCDFYSTPQVETMEQYVHSLLCEARLRKNEIDSEQVSTLYIGGGTPSVMPTSMLTTLITGLDKVFGLKNVEEFTIEVNPDDVTTHYVTALRALGVNRVSMGVQSFNDDELQAINRRHTAKQAIHAVNSIKDAGIDNVSVDLIYGLPGQSLDSWQHNVEQAIALDVQHISAYCLSYEKGTRLWAMREQGKVMETSDELCIAMYENLVKSLKKAGFEHYEISNFALPGFRSRHNSSYWNFTPYLGLGAAAHSYDGNVRRYNPSSIRQYIKALSGGSTAYSEEHLELWERHDEEIMLRLRTSDGLDTTLFEHRYGQKACENLLSKSKPLIEQGLLNKDNNTLILTHKGVMLSDNIIRNLMWD
ncbi:MAG: radical SAM family heme chaperone HemW [Muribaculaceae bacterium]|nr:radical SAM family heme chaperone HemW [Muribaculaceae bacterium]